ncbi:hypothetical protein IV203_027385 [Nitzschia inconspicua]|uniref:Uncharacterized protein n=1 Tax=Nitzschia inconspicua TaxID=303405 RepID=A0A9K3LWZ2_9STRA|nr:hypothetical protein IV203_027385 [Nitzschia inconspicua]
MMSPRQMSETASEDALESIFTPAMIPKMFAPFKGLGAGCMLPSSWSPHVIRQAGFSSATSCFGNGAGTLHKSFLGSHLTVSLIPLLRD